MAAKYLLKKRSWGLGQRNPWRGGKRIPTVTKWKTMFKADTLEEAWSQKPNTGIDEWAVFYRGVRRTDNYGRFLNDLGSFMTPAEIKEEAEQRRAEMPHKSYVPEVEVQGEWHSNALRFATYSEAKSYAQDLYNRWLLCSGFRASPSKDAVTHVWIDGQGLRQVTEPEGSERMPARSVQL